MDEWSWLTKNEVFTISTVVLLFNVLFYYTSELTRMDEANEGED